MSTNWKDRDWAAVESTIHRPTYVPSDGHAQIQWKKEVPLSARKPRRGCRVDARLTMKRLEWPACKTAIIQALRYHFGLHVMEIAKLMKVPPQTVSSLTIGIGHNVHQWHERRFQQEAIEAARKLINENLPTDTLPTRA